MAARKPSHRSHNKTFLMKPDLTPMMNLVTVLIPVLLISIVFIKVVSIEVALAQGQVGTTPPDDKKPLHLKLEISTKGYRVSAAESLQKFVGSSKLEDNGSLFIPLKQEETSCNHYLGTRPPPRTMNRDRPRCQKFEDTHRYTVYDQETLFQVVRNIKKDNQHETELIIKAEENTEYEAITNAMDTARGTLTGASPTGYLFPRVSLSQEAL